MKNSVWILTGLVLAYSSVIYAQSDNESDKLRSHTPKSIFFLEGPLADDFETYVYIDSLIPVNDDFNSILSNITGHFNEPVFVRNFSIVFAQNQDSTYIEIIGGVLPTFEIRKGGVVYFHNGNEKALGRFNFNGYNFYVSSFLPPYAPGNDIIDTFFKKSQKRCRIEQKTNQEGYRVLFENPMWLFRYSDGHLVLVNTLNDDGYYSNPDEVKRPKGRKGQRIRGNG